MKNALKPFGTVDMAVVIICRSFWERVVRSAWYKQLFDVAVTGTVTLVMDKRITLQSACICVHSMMNSVCRGEGDPIASN